MRLEDLVCSYEQAAKLKQLGIQYENVFFYCWNGGYFNHDGSKGHVLMKQDWAFDLWREVLPTYTAGELGELLPRVVEYGTEHYLQYDCYGRPAYKGSGHLDWIYATFPEGNHSEAFYRAETLIYLIENNYLKVK